MFVRVADYQADAGESCDFFRGALGVAAGDYDLCVGILATYAADGGASVLIGACGDRAGVHYHYRGLRGCRGAGDALRFELAFQSGAVGLSGAAAEVLDVVPGHLVMLAQVRVGSGKSLLLEKGTGSEGVWKKQKQEQSQKQRTGVSAPH